MSKGLTVNVLRPAANGWGDCTNGGVSSRHARLTVVGVLDSTRTVPTLRPMPADSRVFEPTADAPAVWLMMRRIGERDVWSIIPAAPATDTSTGAAPRDIRGLTLHVSRWMAGGNYAATSDSRLSAIVRMYGAVAIHDRTEG